MQFTMLESGMCSCGKNHGHFTHLHGHTKYSVRDSISVPIQLAKRAIELGMKYIAITDHGVASGWIDMAKACKQATLDAVKAEIESCEAQGLPYDEDALKQKYELKFIPGVEMYETDDRTLQTQADMNAIGVTEYNGYHFLMLPRTDEGLVNLNRIISDASINGQFNARNRTDLTTIRNNGWGKGIIATSACISGRMSKYILGGRFDEAKAFGLECAQVFDEFYLELQDNGIKDQYIINQGLIQIGKDTGLPIVYTGDYHYVDKDDIDMHDNWVCIGWKKEKDKNQTKYPGGPYHLASAHEMWEAVEQGRIPEEAYHNATKIAESCDVNFDFGRNRFPKYKFTPVGHTADSWLRHKAFEKLYEYLLECEEDLKPVYAQNYIDRLNYELKVIADKGYSDYFLILDDIFTFCRDEEIETGPGRGSGAGALVAYVLMITDVDPIENKLLFERFLNPERKSAPDIDFDIQNDRREEVFIYIRDRFGSDHVAQIITYGEIKLRSGMDHLCRIYKEVNDQGEIIKYGSDVADEIKKSIPGKFPDQTEPTYAKMKKLAEDPQAFADDFREDLTRLHEQAKAFMAHMNQHPEIHDALKVFEGLVDNYGRHAAAVVITDEPITNHVPVYQGGKDAVLPVTAFNMKEIDEDLQMLKVDALALKTLTVVQQAVKHINDWRDPSKPKFNIRKIPMDDYDTYKTIRDGHTIGVFQLVGNAITQYTKKVKPQVFGELTDILALFRPGPLEALVDKNTTMAEKYIENADEDELDRFMDTIPVELHHVYKDTRGILNYQEQIMQLCQDMAGYTLGGADILRRAIGKKLKPLIQMVQFEFVYGTDAAIPMAEKYYENVKARNELNAKDFNELTKELKSLKSKTGKVMGAIAMGFDEQYSITTYEAIERFAGYSFNRSHSAAYAKLAYQTAYLKTHYPVEFMTAQLTVESSDVDNRKERKIVRNVQEARRLGIKVLPPDINKSKVGFSIEWIDVIDDQGNVTGQEKAIRFGLLSIAGVGDAAVNEILSRPVRDEDAATIGEKYINFDDFYSRVSKRTINKKFMTTLIRAGCFDFDIQNRHQLLNHFYFNLRKDKEYFGTRANFEKDKPKAEISFREFPDDFNEDIVCAWEEELFGFFLTYHPFEELPYTNWDDVRVGQKVEMGGKITKIKKIKTKSKNEDMAFLTVDTAGGKIDVTVFPKQFKEYELEMFAKNIAIFEGRKDAGNDGRTGLVLDTIKKARKKKFKVERPPELQELAARARKGKKGQMTLDDLGGATMKADPLLALFGEEVADMNRSEDDDPEQTYRDQFPEIAMLEREENDLLAQGFGESRNEKDDEAWAQIRENSQGYNEVVENIIEPIPSPKMKLKAEKKPRPQPVDADEDELAELASLFD